MDAAGGADSAPTPAAKDGATQPGDAATWPARKNTPSTAEATESSSVPGTVRRGWGRYRLERKLGAGGCSVVFVGKDRDLDRTVAIKLLRAQEGDLDQRRLLTEARALAQLSHPNIVEVFDVGIFDERDADVPSIAPARQGIYVVLELVDGLPLDEWLEDKDPSWRTVIDIFVQAGRGLAAAHEAGVVHRDFKPSNVVVARDGRARVLDFGLAMMADDPPESSTALSDALELGVAQGLTATGALMGTPAYMAPEQHEGRLADEGSDQFAFCVALYEALWRLRPFPGPGLEPLYTAKIEGLPVQPDRPLAGVPTRIYDAIRRGTAVKPSARWPSMAELLAVLEDARRPARWWWWAAGIGVASLTAAVVWSESQPSDVPDCAQEGAVELAAVWNEGARETARRAFEATAVPGAQATWTRVAPRLDGFTQRWTEAHRAWCTARGGESLAVDRQRQCLRERLARFGGLVERVVTPSPEVVRHALDEVLALPDPGACQREGAGRDEKAQALLDQLAGIAGGKRLAADEGLRQLDAMHAEIDAADDDGIRSRAKFLRGSLLDELGDYADAAAVLEEAFHEAEAAEDDTTSFDAATSLVRLHSYQLGDTDEGLQWARHAESRLDRLDDPGREFRLRQERAAVYMRTGRTKEARAELDRATQLVDAADPRALRVAETRAHLAGTEGRYDEALAAWRDISAKAREIYGEDHPRTRTALYNLGVAHARLGDDGAALEKLREAEAIGARVLGPREVALAETRNSLATVLLRMRRYEEARPTFEGALEILESTEHAAERMRSLQGLGVIARRSGDLEAAERYFRRIIDDAVTADTKLDAANAYGNLAATLAERDDWDGARGAFESAIASASEGLTSGHPRLAPFHSALAKVEAKGGDFAAAKRQLARAREITDAAKQPSLTRTIVLDTAEVLLIEGKREEATRMVREILTEAQAAGNVAIETRAKEMLETSAAATASDVK